MGLARTVVRRARREALEHITIAADRFERHGGYMHMVVRVHARRS
jgi:hypothetical protein